MTTASTTSLTVVPNAFLISLNSSSPARTTWIRRCGPGATLNGVSGGALSAVHATSLMPVATSRALPSASPGFETAPSAPLATSVTARTAPVSPRAASSALDGSGWGTHGSLPSLEPSGERSNSTLARSTPETPSTSAWWVFESRAKPPSFRPSTSHSSHSGFERSRRWENTRAGERQQRRLVTGLGQGGVADVVGEVERRVVDPQRPAGLERRDRELLAVARDEMQARLDVGEELVEPGRLALEDREPADVHVRVRLLLREEARVDR